MELRIGTWNVRTLLSPGKMAEVAEELIRYKMDVTAIQEIRWKEQGNIRKKEYQLFYSGASRQGYGGVGFIINKKTSKSIIGFTPYDERICKLRLRGRFHNLSLICVYAPTEEAEETMKTQFYEDLQTTIETCSKHDCIIVLGDLNAKIGQEECNREVAGRQSLHLETNENGKRIVQLAVMNDLKIASTSFVHKTIHKGTWIIPGTTECNQIDHVLISKRWATSIEDVRVYRGANCDSDHFLLISKFRHRIANIKRAVTRRLRSAEQLKDKDKIIEYRSKLEEILSTKVDITGIENEWNFLKESIITATDETLVSKTSRRQEWFDADCRTALKVKNDARMKMLQNHTRRNRLEYEQHRREAKALCKKKKKAFLREKIEDLLKSFKKNDNRKFFRDSSNLVKRYIPRVMNCRDTSGQILDDGREIKQRWQSYFKELLTTDDTSTAHSLTIDEYSNTEIPEPTYEEMMCVVKRLRTNKAPGSDGIRAEFLKTAGDKVMRRIYELVLQIWKDEVFPDDWKMGLIIPIHKKGDRLDCNNYRGITLLNVTYKIFTCIIYQKLVPFAEATLGEYQCGFRANHSTVEQIHMVRNIIEKFNEYNIDLCALFVDFRQAFDRVDRKKLVKVLAVLKMPMKLVKLIDLTLRGSRAAVIIQNEQTEAFEINVGVRQGDALSPLLFNLILEYVVRQLDLSGTICYKTAQICAFADDLVILCRRRSTLIYIMRRLISAAAEVGLEINAGKTKYMERSKTANVQVKKLSVDHYDFERVHSFTYLGSIITESGSNTEEIQARIIKGNRAYFLYSYLFKNKLLTISLKYRLYKTIIRPIVTYGSETWTLTKKDENDLLIFERKVVRRIIGPKKVGDQWRIRTNAEIEHILKGKNIVRFIKSHRLSWFGHIERTNNNNRLKKILNWKPMGTRPRGRPRKRWKDDVLENLDVMKIRSWREKIGQRAVWNKIVEQAKAHNGL